MVHGHSQSIDQGCVSTDSPLLCAKAFVCTGHVSVAPFTEAHVVHDHYQCIDPGCVCEGRVPATVFRLAPSQESESPSAMQAWLQQAQTDSPIDQVPDVMIETGVFKVKPPVTQG